MSTTKKAAATNRPRSDIAYLDNREWLQLNGDELWEVGETSGGGIYIVGPTLTTPTDDPLSPHIERTQVNILAADAMQLARALTKVAAKPLGLKTKPRKKT